MNKSFINSGITTFFDHLLNIYDEIINDRLAIICKISFTSIGNTAVLGLSLSRLADI